MKMTISEIAENFALTRQGVYVQLKSGKFPAVKEFGTRWMIDFDDYLQYYQQRYDRKYRKKDDDTLVFDKSKGIYSVIESADYLCCPLQKIYYNLRKGRIPSKRYKAAWLIHIDDLNKFKEQMKAPRKRTIYSKPVQVA